MKSGKKIIFESPRESFKVNGGAVVNYKNPVSVYVKLTSWISYNEIDSLNEVVKILRKDLRMFFKEHRLVQEYFNYSTIINLSISESRIKLNKPTFFEVDLTFYQKNHAEGLPLVAPKNKDVKNLKPVLQGIVNDFLNSNLLDKHGFTFHYNISEASKEMY